MKSLDVRITRHKIYANQVNTGENEDSGEKGGRWSPEGVRWWRRDIWWRQGRTGQGRKAVVGVEAREEKDENMGIGANEIKD